MSAYQRMISKELKKKNLNNYDPRHVEAFMRLEHSTLDGLSQQQFMDEISVCIHCINDYGITQSERLAKSYGL